MKTTFNILIIIPLLALASIGIIWLRVYGLPTFSPKAPLFKLTIQMQEVTERQIRMEEMMKRMLRKMESAEN